MKTYHFVLVTIILFLSSCNKNIHKNSIQQQTDIKWKKFNVESNFEYEIEQKDSIQITNTLIEKIKPFKTINKKINKIILANEIKATKPNQIVTTNEHFAQKSTISKNTKVNKTQCGGITMEFLYILLGIFLLIIGLLIWGIVVAPLLTSIISATLTLLIIIWWNNYVLS